MAKFEPKPFGKYFLTDRIAVGGMAEIYKAKTFGVDGFEKVLAIKKILSHCSADIEFITMLTDEAKLVVNLSHANIVQVYDLGRVGDDYFISMEFIDGINLRDLVEKSRELHEPIPIDIAIYIISEVCRGLDYAHSKKGTDGEPLEIIHRDISPQNILVSYDGGVKIVDFGIAKAARNLSQTHAGILKGKVNYMAPEQAFGKPMDKRTDVFSLGNVFYELITCKRLFYGESQMEILKKIRNQKITETTFEDDVPNTIKPLLAR
ncbi:serine/threonine protein kinase, partial [bacterium]|nr:serine/threonine protein kinase [bacterium]MBU1919045.1 serine/threonine protein kinase [bacterium]